MKLNRANFTKAGVKIMAEKTFLELAKEIGVSKQAVYRCFKRLPREAHQEAHQENGVIYLSDVLQTRIKSEFKTVSASSEAHQEVLHDVLQTASDNALFDVVIATLKEQLAVKDRQIELLQQALAQEQENVKLAQQLHGADKVQSVFQLPQENEQKEKPRWRSWLPWMKKD